MGEGSAATPGEIARAVRRLFEKAAAERPLVVVFDDIHWGEPTPFAREVGSGSGLAWAHGRCGRLVVAAACTGPGADA